MEKHKTPKARMLALVLAVALACALFPATAFAALPDKGYTMDDNNGELTITSADGYRNWKDDIPDKDRVSSVVIDSGAGSQLPAGAFTNCSKLANVSIPDSVTSIGATAFYNCKSLTEIIIPDSVTSIGAEAFRWTSALTSVTLSSGLTQLDRAVFWGSGLTEITIPAGITEMGNGVFSECKSLDTVTFQDGTKIIGPGLFSDCSVLTSIELPASVESIGEFAFFNCTSLREFTVKGDTPASLGDSAFFGLPADFKIYVPEGTADTYKAADGWKEYKDHIVGGNEPTPPTPPSGNPSSSGGGKSSWVPTTGANVIDVPQGTLGLGTYNNYDKLLVAGLEKLVEQNKGKTVSFDTLENGKVLYRIKLDPAKLAGVLKNDLSLNAHIGQNDAAVLDVTNRFAKYYANSIVAITYDQAKPLGVSAEFAARLDLSKLNAKTLYFYSYDNTTNTYARIAAPNHFVDVNGYSHITAPLGGSILITDKPLASK